MTKAEMVTKVHEALDGKITKAEAEKAMTALFTAISEEFVAGRDVSVAGFGSFKVKTRSERNARNPRTGETVHVEAKKTVTFKPVTKLKETMNTK